MNKLIIIGAGGHGRVIADIAYLNGYRDIAFLDDADIETSGGFPVVGKVSDFEKYSGSDFVVAFGDNMFRERITRNICEYGLKLITLIHPRAVLARDVVVGKGTVIMAGAVVNTGTIIGDGSIINTCSSVDHDCVIGAYSHIAVGAHVAGEVKVGDRVFIGAGGVVIHDIKICDDTVVGAGAVVVKNVLKKGVYVGVPATLIK